LDKPPATIQIDLDSLEAIQECYGWENFPEGAKNLLYEEGTKNFLDLLESHNIKATFFVIGKDAQDSFKKTIISEIHNRGHEIANHSFSHTIGLSRLNDNEIIKEIKTAEAAIGNITGIKTKGFRSPGYDINSRILKILDDSSYEYDSSLLPSFYGSLFRLADSFISRERSRPFPTMRDKSRTTKKKRFGRFIDGFAPLKPYRPDEKKYWHRGSTLKIVEVPITTIPIIRFPFHSTIIFKFGTPIFDMGFMFLKKYNIPINYLFHIIDLVDIKKIKGLERLFFLKLSLEKRRAIVKYIIEKIKNDYTIMKTTDYVKAF
jgi:peptidoglycan/xylan/chitin deacetylase (PgdA/CDA1 family)